MFMTKMIYVWSQYIVPSAGVKWFTACYTFHTYSSQSSLCLCPEPGRKIKIFLHKHNSSGFITHCPVTLYPVFTLEPSFYLRLQSLKQSGYLTPLNTKVTLPHQRSVSRKDKCGTFEVRFVKFYNFRLFSPLVLVLEVRSFGNKMRLKGYFGTAEAIRLMSSSKWSKDEKLFAAVVQLSPEDNCLVFNLITTREVVI